MSAIPAGYKQTDVGVIPEDWETDCIGNKTTKVGSGITPTGGEKVYKRDGRPFLRSQNIGWGYLLLDDIAFIDDAIHDTFKATEIETGDVFLNITGASIGRSAVADARVENGNVNQHVCIIRTAKSQLDSYFLNYFLLSNVGQRQIDSFQAGGNRQGLNFEQIRSFQLPVLPLPEQRAIAAALLDVDALLAKLDQFIAKKRDLKQAAMQQLLTGQTRLPGFSGAWEMKRLGDVLSYLGNGAVYESANSFGVPVTRIETIADGTIDFSRVGYAVPTDELKKYKLQRGDILFSHINSIDHIGKVAFYESDTALYHGMNLLLLRAADAVMSRYLFYWLGSRQGRKQSAILAKQAVSQASINTAEMKGIEIPLPHLPEQTAIATVLSDMDAELATLEARRDKTRALKQGMMQKLLTGRIRLV